MGQEDNGQGESQPNETENNKEGHPAWGEILEGIPEVFHSQVKPILEKWDKGVQAKIQSLHDQYDPYKNFIDNQVPAEVLEQAYAIAESLYENPQEMVAKAIEEFKLDYVPKEMLEELRKQQNQQEPKVNENGEQYFELEEEPQFLALQREVEELKGTLTKEQQRSLEAQQKEEYESYMEQLHDKFDTDGGVKFDDTYVTALLSAGVDGEQAVKMYFDAINQAAALIANNGNTQENNTQVNNPPVVLGGSGESGSGISQQETNFAKMQSSDRKKIIAEILTKSKTG